MFYPWGIFVDHNAINSSFLDHTIILYAVRINQDKSHAIKNTRRALSQFLSFEVRRTTFLNYIKFTGLLIVRL